MSDLEIRDRAGHKEAEGEVLMDKVEAESRVEYEELLKSRLDEAINVLGMAGMLGVLGEIAAEKPQQNWGKIAGLIENCGCVVRQYEEKMEQ